MSSQANAAAPQPGKFKYRAVDAAGKTQTGAVSAESERDAMRILRSRSLTPLQLTPAKAGGGRGKRIKAADVLAFTNGLCTLVESRVPIDRALRLLEGITESEAMRELTLELLREVKEGRSLAAAMEAHPGVFSKMYVNIIRAGEEGGILDQLLPELAEFLETSAETRQTIISAMIYPAVLLVTGIVSVILLLVFVVPQFAAMFEDAGTQIPPAAQFLLNLSQWLQSFGFFIPLAIITAVFAWRRLDTQKSTRLKRDRFLLGLPLLGPLILTRESAVFARTLGSLLGAGIPLIRALRVAREVVANEQLTSQLALVEEDVRGGSGLGAALEKTQQFPTLLHQLVAVGEESGRTGSILLKSAITFDSLVRNQLSKLVAALQPALILLLALAVGGITITMLSAVFSMNAVEF